MPTNGRVNYLVPVHHASTRPLGTKKLPVLNLEMLDQVLQGALPRQYTGASIVSKKS